MSLSTKEFFADVARQRVLGLFATPGSFRLNQSPLGAIHQPQAPTVVDTLRYRRAFRWLGWGGAFIGSRRVPHHLFRPHGSPAQ